MPSSCAQSMQSEASLANRLLQRVDNVACIYVIVWDSELSADAEGIYISERFGLVKMLSRGSRVIGRPALEQRSIEQTLSIRKY